MRGSRIIRRNCRAPHVHWIRR